MAVTLNKRIIEKLDEYECSEIAKQFLKELLVFELDEGTSYRKQYDRAIEKYVRKYVEAE